MLEPGVFDRATSMEYGLNPKLLLEWIMRSQKIYVVSNALMSRRLQHEVDDKACSRDNRHPVKIEP